MSAAKKVLRDFCPNVDAGFIRERLDDLKGATQQVLQLSLDHLSILTGPTARRTLLQRPHRFKFKNTYILILNFKIKSRPLDSTSFDNRR